MTTRATEKRLAALEVRRGPAALIHCVQVGTGPALQVDGSECTVHHDRVIVLGGLAHASKSNV